MMQQKSSRKNLHSGDRIQQSPKTTDRSAHTVAKTAETNHIEDAQERHPVHNASIPEKNRILGIMCNSVNHFKLITLAQLLPRVATGRCRACEHCK